MKLKNPFSNETRHLFFDTRYTCFFCGANNNELHHISGRISSSALNASVLCKECHGRVGHDEKEEKLLFLKTLNYLTQQGYTITEKDLKFIQSYKRLRDVIHDQKV